MNHNTESDRKQHDFHNAHEHGNRGDIHPLFSEHPDQERSHNRSEKRGAGSDGHRKRKITAGKERHHVGSRSARAAANQNHTNSDLGRQMHHEAEQIGNDRHNEELGQNADNHITRLTNDFPEVRGRKSQPHAEHHDTKQRGNVGTKRLKSGREGIGERTDNDDPKRKCLIEEKT